MKVNYYFKILGAFLVIFMTQDLMYGQGKFLPQGQSGIGIGTAAASSFGRNSGHAGLIGLNYTAGGVFELEISGGNSFNESFKNKQPLFAFGSTLHFLKEEKKPLGLSVTVARSSLGNSISEMVYGSTFYKTFKPGVNKKILTEVNAAYHNTNNYFFGSAPSLGVGGSYVMTKPESQMAVGPFYALRLNSNGREYSHSVGVQFTYQSLIKKKITS